MAKTDIVFKLAGNSGDRVQWHGRIHASGNVPELVIVTDSGGATATPTETAVPPPTNYSDCAALR